MTSDVASFIMFFIYLQMHKKSRLLQGVLEVSWVISNNKILRMRFHFRVFFSLENQRLLECNGGEDS